MSPLFRMKNKRTAAYFDWYGVWQQTWQANRQVRSREKKTSLPVSSLLQQLNLRFQLTDAVICFLEFPLETQDSVAQ